jgi:hypothetical protein
VRALFLHLELSLSSLLPLYLALVFFSSLENDLVLNEVMWLYIMMIKTFDNGQNAVF